VDAADDRLVKALHAEDAAVQALDERAARIAVEERRRDFGAVALLIAARPERASSPGEDDHSHCGVGLELDQGALDPAHQPLGPGVEALGAIERESDDAFVPMVLDGSGGHSRAP